MRNTVQKRFTQTVTVAVALLVVLSVFGLIGTVAAQDVSVEQSANEVTAAPGETVELTTTLSITDLNAHGLQVYLPGEWEGTITDADGGAPKPAEGSGNPLEVVWLTLEESHDVTYEVHVPEDADEGEYTVDVDGSAIVPDTGERVVDSTQTTITVEQEDQGDQNEAPTASFTSSPDSPEAGQEVTFDASGSSDDSGIASYEWDVDGDGVTDATGAQATHTFDAAGEYDVTLTVTDDDGETDSVTQTLSVGEDSDDSDEDDSDDSDEEDDSDQDDSDDSDDEGDDSDDSGDGEDDSDDDDSDEEDSDEEDSDQKSGDDCTPEEDESPDSDGDGLTDAEEKELGTDPYDADTDGDCVSDGDEVEAGTDPLCSDCC